MCIRDSDRSALWYHLSAIANSCVGNRMTALDHARRAVQMDPGNPEYRQTLEQLQQTGRVYQQTRRTVYSTMGGVDLSRVCLGLCLCNACLGGSGCCFPGGFGYYR